MNPQPPSVQGAVDLAELKAAAQQRQALAVHGDQMCTQLLTQAGLICPCGARIRDQGVQYFAIAEGPVQTARGTELGLNLLTHTCCSTSCVAGRACEQGAIARRDRAGRVVWLDELRLARTAANN